MSAIDNPEAIFALRETCARDQAASDKGAQHWHNILEVAAQIAEMAALTPEASDEARLELPASIASLPPESQKIAIAAIEDIEAILKPGLEALTVIRARGSDVTVPAQALYREFDAARAALLALVSQHS